ncbi:MAG TPA: PKD domain-containing protein, partial [Prolixibacteraceae bacterium]|nr:PKD domain-containing protein [Prolixibacteraceae bacterium]
CIALTSLTLRSSVLHIGNQSFWGCINLASIYSNSPVPPTISNTFDEAIKSTCILYVPFGSKELYAVAEGWQDFANIEEMPGFSLSSSAITIASKNGSTGSVVLSSNALWTASSDQSWLTVSPTSGNGDETLTFTAERNNSGAARTATVSVSLPDGEPQTVMVTQEVNNPNQAPIANAGADQSVNERSTVTLDGTASSDPDNDDELTYSWTAPEGIELSSATSVSPTFTAPEVNTDTNFTFSLVVNDGTVSSAADEVVISIRNNNRAPVSDAGDDQSVNEGSIVTLDGSTSSDPDENDLTYLWTAPGGITLSSATVANPSFTAPEVNSDTNYTFSLVVNDGTVSSSADEVVISIRNDNRAPVAHAGDDQTVNEGTLVTLDGSASSDQDGDALTYLWTAPPGFELSSATTVNPSFTAPQVSADTQYTFSLVVNDGTVSSTADEVVITIGNNNRAPVAHAGDNQSVNQGATVTLDGSASSDPDDDDLTYLWTAPEGIELNSPTSVHPTFTAPQVIADTDYTFTLVVNDGTVNSLADDVVIHLEAENRAPVANAGADLFVHEGALITLDGSGSLDPDLDELTYLWTAPVGITLSSATSVHPSFTAPEVSVDTEFTFSLAVSDGTDVYIVDRVMVTVMNSNFNQHFSVARIGNENEQMNFYVSMARINGIDLQEGDEMAVFDGLTCVGAAVVRQVLDSNNHLCIKVYLDNPATFIKDGFITGHTPTVRLWNSVTNKEAILMVFDYEPGSSQVFEVMGTATIAINAVVSALDELTEGAALLGNNYPNPFSNQTILPYFIARETSVDISIYDMTGRKITTLVHGNLQPGDYKVTWNKNAAAKPGVYICKMQTDVSVLTKLIIAE